MARNRMVKADFWVSEQIVSCSRDARLLFIGLWCFCDDAGVHPASLKRLKMEVFPGDNCSEDDIKHWLDELLQYGLIREYAVQENLYWIVTGWKKHQKIDKPTYRFPVPKSELKEVSNDSKQLILANNSTRSSRIVADCSVNTGLEVATKEKKGKEKEKKKYIHEVGTSSIDISETDLSASTQIFQHWQTVMNHPKAKLDNKRQCKISQALKLYNVSDLKLAIDGCANTPYNMGKNTNNQCYDDIGLILRDADHIERFINNASLVSNNEKDMDYSRDLMAGVL